MNALSKVLASFRLPNESEKNKLHAAACALEVGQRRSFAERNMPYRKEEKSLKRYERFANHAASSVACCTASCTKSTTLGNDTNGAGSQTIPPRFVLLPSVAVRRSPGTARRSVACCGAFQPALRSYPVHFCWIQSRQGLEKDVHVSFEPANENGTVSPRPPPSLGTQP